MNLVINMNYRAFIQVTAYPAQNLMLHFDIGDDIQHRIFFIGRPDLNF